VKSQAPIVYDFVGSADTALLQVKCLVVAAVVDAQDRRAIGYQFVAHVSKKDGALEITADAKWWQITTSTPGDAEPPVLAARR